MKLVFGIFKREGRIAKAEKVGDETKLTIEITGGGSATVTLSPDDKKTIDAAEQKKNS